MALSDIVASIRVILEDDVSAPLAKITAEAKAAQAEITASANGMARSQNAAWTVAVSGAGKASTAVKDVATAQKTAAIEGRNLETALKATTGEMTGLSTAALLTKGNIGLAAVALGAFTVYEGAKWQTTLTEMRNNTTATNAQFDAMRSTIERLGSSSPAHLDDIANAARRVSDYGFKAADSTKILQIALESAVSTGSRVEDVANTLGATMHAFGISADGAAHAMDTIHLAANLGNLTLEQTTEVFGTVGSYAAAIGVPLQDVAAALATMTRNGMDAATSGTQIKDVLIHIVNPGKAARAEIEALSKATGIDLVRDFSQAGLHAKGLFGVMGDLKDATHGNVQEMAHLIPNMRGLLAEMVLTGNGAKDYASILKQLNAAQGQTEAAYARSQKTLDFWMGTLHNQVILAAADLGQKLIPEMKNTADAVHEYLKPVTFTIKVVENLPVVKGHAQELLNSLIHVTMEGGIPFQEGWRGINDVMLKNSDTMAGALHTAMVNTRVELASQQSLVSGLTSGWQTLGQEIGKTAGILGAALSQPSPYTLGAGGHPGYGAGGDTTMYSTFPGVRALDETSKKAAASVSLHSAKVDMLTAAQDQLQRAENAAYADLAAGHPITVAHREAIKADAEKVKDMTDAVNNIISPAKALAQTFNTVAGQISTAIGAAADAIRKALVKAGLVKTPKGYGNQYLDTSIPVEVQYGAQAESRAQDAYAAWLAAHPPPTTPTGYYQPGGGQYGPPPEVALGGAAWAAANTGTPTTGANRGNLVSPQVGYNSSVTTGINTAALSTAVSGALSRYQAATSAQQAIQSAKLQLFVDDSNRLVSLTQFAITATQNQTAIIAAQSSVAHASMTAQIQSVKDQATLATDIKSGTAQQVAIDRAQIALDQSTAATQVTLAKDVLKEAQDKAAIDKTLGAFQIEIAQHQFDLDKAKYVLEVANQKLNQDQLSVLGDATNYLAQLAGGTYGDVGQMFGADISALSAAQQGVGTAQQSLAGYNVGYAQAGASGNLLLAGDAQQQASDAASGQGQQDQLQLALTTLQSQGGPVVSAIQSLQGTVQQGNQQSLQQQSQAQAQTIAAMQEQIDRLEGLLSISTQGLQNQMGWVGPAAVNQLGTAGIANRGH